MEGKYYEIEIKRIESRPNNEDSAMSWDWYNPENNYSVRVICSDLNGDAFKTYEAALQYAEDYKNSSPELSFKIFEVERKLVKTL